MSIVPLVARPNISPTYSAEVALTGSLLIGAGDVAYASGGQNLRLFWTNNYLIDSIINRGTIWQDGLANVSAAIAGFNIRHFENSGTLVGQAHSGNAGGLSVGGSGETVNNSGAILATTDAGTSIALEHYGNPEIVNSGVVAAQAKAAGPGGVGQAIGIAITNGADLLNDTNGAILAEGVYANAINGGFGGSILNKGRIEAASLDPSHPSAGITIGFAPPIGLSIENAGLIKADVAIDVAQGYYVAGFSDGAFIVNDAGGTIVGAVKTGLGADHFVNKGSLIGDLATGDGDDLFESTAGSWSGVADLGAGNDHLVGSAAGDIVKGGKGSDLLEGGGGNDLLLGGIGTDILRGGSGDDALYGESGADTLETSGGDLAFGGAGADKIVAGDLSFRLINGGDGVDTLAFSQAGLALDISSAIASGRLNSIERIDLSSGQAISIRSGDAFMLAGGQLEILGTGQVVLDAGWTEGASAVQGGLTFRSFTSASEKIFVQQGTQVFVGLTPGFLGLAAIADGPAAPQAGTVRGGELTDPVSVVSNYNLSGTIEIGEDETWKSSGAPIIYAVINAELFNYGTVSLANSSPDYAISALAGDNWRMVHNLGVIEATGTGNSYVAGYSTGNQGSLENSGIIRVVAEGAGYATGAHAASTPFLTLAVDNTGLISASSASGRATGLEVTLNGSSGSNEDRIEATGGSGTAAVKLYSGGQFTNTGSIVAANTSGLAQNDSVGLFASSLYRGTTILNHGLIAGETGILVDRGAAAITNGGTIKGGVKLSDASDVVVNSGMITGLIDLGGGDDRYDGTGAGSAAQISAGDGNDSIFLADSPGVSTHGTADGGAGTDSLTTGASATIDLATGVVTLVGASYSISGFEKIYLTTGGFTSAGYGDASDNWFGVSVAFDDGRAGVTLDGRAGNDSLFGSAGGDTILGGFGNDTLSGYRGDDILDGGAGDDTIDGGDGFDFASYASAAGGVAASLNITSAQQTGAGNDLLRTVEGLIGSAFDDVLIGSGGGNQLFGGAGDDRLYGDDPTSISGGNDQLFGETGADQLYGLAGDDALFGGDGDDYLSGGDGNDDLSGSAGADELQGGAGTDRLLGNDGLDRLFGGDGGDYLDGGAGGDILIAGDGGDIVYGGADDDYVNGEGGDDYIDGGDGYDVLLGGDGADQLVGGLLADNLQGGLGADRLYGGDGGDILYGQGGADILLGEAGDDYIAGGTEDDYANGGSGADVVLGQEGNDVLLGLDGADTLQGGDGRDVLYGGSEGDTLYGDGGGDILIGESGDDVLIGGADDDYLHGGDGHDYLQGDDGADVLVGAAGMDHLFGGTGDDNLQGGLDNDYLDGGDGNDVLYGDGGNDTLIGRGGDDYAVGGAGDDYAALGNGNDVALGGDGNDTLYGGAGRDIIYGDAGADSLVGEADDDILHGGDGNDMLIGGDGNDVLLGEGGNDILVGGAGADLFIIHGGQGSDTIADFSSGDSIRLESVEVTDFAGLMAEASMQGANTVFMFGSGETLILQNVAIASLSASSFVFA
jgi:Ca2+-binding RTX toxin-like protein